VCVERTRYWQAEYWTSAVRDHALTMACLRLGLPGHYGKGFDSLPDEIRTRAAAALVFAVNRLELLKALRRGTDLLLAEGASGRRVSAAVVRTSARFHLNGLNGSLWRVALTDR